VSRPPAWPSLVRRASILGDETTSSKRLAARYGEDGLPRVVKFIHDELGLQGGLDVYNIQYPESVASAQATEAVDDVVERLGPDVQRFILPMFRGRNRSIRVEHVDRTMVAEAPDFASIETLRDRWSSVVGEGEGVFYGLRVTGRAHRSGQVTKVAHLVLQVAALYDGAEPRLVTVERSAGPGGRTETVQSTVEVPEGALLCSDCSGYHAPGVGTLLTSHVSKLTFGSCTMRLERDDDVFVTTLVVPTSAYTIEYDSRSLAKAKDVDSLVGRMTAGDDAR